jgi:hypothetical protein
MFRRITMMMAVALLAGCAVGPDFVQPTAPDVARYTKEPLASRTSSTDVNAALCGRPRRFQRTGGEYSTRGSLNTLVDKSLVADPTLQSAIAALRAAKENVYAQQGKYFPLVQANYGPSRQETSAVLSPTPTSGATLFNLYTAQESAGSMDSGCGHPERRCRRASVGSVIAHSDHSTVTTRTTASRGTFGGYRSIATESCGSGTNGWNVQHAEGRSHGIQRVPHPSPFPLVLLCTRGYVC